MSFKCISGHFIHYPTKLFLCKSLHASWDGGVHKHDSCPYMDISFNFYLTFFLEIDPQPNPSWRWGFVKCEFSMQIYADISFNS